VTGTPEPAPAPETLMPPDEPEDDAEEEDDGGERPTTEEAVQLRAWINQRFAAGMSAELRRRVPALRRYEEAVGRA